MLLHSVFDKIALSAEVIKTDVLNLPSSIAFNVVTFYSPSNFVL